MKVKYGLFPDNMTANFKIYGGSELPPKTGSSGTDIWNCAKLKTVLLQVLRTEEGCEGSNRGAFATHATAAEVGDYLRRSNILYSQHRNLFFTNAG